MENKLYRVSTPTLIYYIDDENFDMSRVASAHFIVQNYGGKNRIVEENPNIDLEEKSFTMDLTQEQTKMLSAGEIEVQVHIKLNNGKVIWTDIVRTRINRVIEETIL